MVEEERDSQQEDTEEPQGDSEEQTTEEEEEFDKERALRTIRNQRESEKQLKQSLSEMQNRVREFEDKDKPELQRLQEENQQLRLVQEQYSKEKRDQITRTAFEESAKRAGALRPTALFRLADALEIDDEGTPRNTSEVIKRLRQEYPEMFSGSSGSADGGAGKDAGAKGDFNMNDLIRRASGRQ